MVRLRAAEPPDFIASNLNFNSSVVRLRDPANPTEYYGIPIFQFQCGAIEGTSSKPLKELQLIFQFQCGAIEGCNYIPF